MGTIQNMLDKINSLSYKIFNDIQEQLLKQCAELVSCDGYNMFTEEDTIKAENDKNILSVATGEDKYPVLELTKSGLLFLARKFSELLGCSVEASIMSDHYAHYVGVESFVIFYKRHAYFWSSLCNSAKLIYHCSIKQYRFLDYHDAAVAFQKLFD